MLSLDDYWWERPKCNKCSKCNKYQVPTATLPTATLPLATTCNLPLAQAYVPLQPYGKMFSPCEALEKGTLFVDLQRPYKYCKGDC